METLLSSCREQQVAAATDIESKSGQLRLAMEKLADAEKTVRSALKLITHGLLLQLMQPMGY